MFCGNCGNQIEEGAAFCPICGGKLESAEDTNVNNNFDNNTYAVQVDNAENKKYKMVGVVSVAVVAVLVVIFACVLFGGRGYKKTVKEYIEATFEMDGKAMLDLLPEDVIDYVREEEDMTKKEMIEEFDDMLEESLEWIELYVGDDLSYLYEIVDVDDYSKRKVNELIEEISDELDIDINVKAAKTVTVEIAVEGEDDDYEYEMDICVVKIGRSWYLWSDGSLI